MASNRLTGPVLLWLKLYLGQYSVVACGIATLTKKGCLMLLKAKTLFGQSHTATKSLSTVRDSQTP